MRCNTTRCSLVARPSWPCPCTGGTPMPRQTAPQPEAVSLEPFLPPRLCACQQTGGLPIGSPDFAIFDCRGWRIYNVVGPVKLFLATPLPRELGAGSRATRAAGRSSQTLDAAPSSPQAGVGTKHGGFSPGFVLADSLGSCRPRLASWNPAVDDSTSHLFGGVVHPRHDSLCELPASGREAQRPIRLAVDLRPLCASPGYWTCEPAA